MLAKQQQEAQKEELTPSELALFDEAEGETSAVKISLEPEVIYFLITLFLVTSASFPGFS